MILRVVLIILFNSIIFSATHQKNCFHPGEQDRGRPELDTHAESPSGHFYIHYNISGEDAPDLEDNYGMNQNNPNEIPDYIDNLKDMFLMELFVVG